MGDPTTVGGWLDLIASEGIADRAEFAARFPSSILVVLEESQGSGDPRGPTVNDHTEMLDASKLKSGAVASRAARTYSIVAPAGGPEVLVGRSKESCGVWIDSSKVSKKHAAFVRDAGGGWVLRDLGSTNGTYVNDRRLDKDERARVSSGDSVRFGRAMKMHFQDAPGFFEYLRLLSRFGL